MELLWLGMSYEAFGGWCKRSDITVSWSLEVGWEITVTAEFVFIVGDF